MNAPLRAWILVVVIGLLAACATGPRTACT